MTDTKEQLSPQGKDPRPLTQEDLYRLFPNAVIDAVRKTEWVDIRPRNGVTYSEFTVRSTSDGQPALVQRFGNIVLNEQEAAELGLEEGVLTVDYLGGDNDDRMLMRLLDLLGEPKEPQHRGFKVFTEPVSVGLFGANKRYDYDRDNERYTQTPQRALFENAVRETQKPVLVIMAHGGSIIDSFGEELKTIGSIDGKTSVALESYLGTTAVSDFSAILDLSCTVNPDYCVNALPGYLPDNCPPFFGCLDENDRALGTYPVDTYLIINGKSQVYPKDHSKQ